jgi:phosphatidylglycerol:prolipoprotein diacylglycerol transferase
LYPTLFHIPFVDLPISGFGLMLVVGFFCAMHLGKYLARRSGIDPEVFVNACLIGLVTGILGARLSHVLENLDQYTDPQRSFGANLLDAVNIRSGGLTYYGGFLLAFPALVWYAIKKKIPVRLGMDIVAPCLMIGLAFGRIGCFLNGCCYGATCDLPWAVRFPYDSIPYKDQAHEGAIHRPVELLHIDEAGRVRPLSQRQIAASPELRQIAAQEHSLPLHPAQLYSTLTAFLIAALCLVYLTLTPAPGTVFALMLLVEGITRFLLELLRAEPSVFHLAGYGITLSMLLGALMVLGGIVLWIAFVLRPGTVPRAAAAV